MTTAHTYGLLVTVNEWLARQSELIACLLAGCACVSIIVAIVNWMYP